MLRLVAGIVVVLKQTSRALGLARFVYVRCRSSVVEVSLTHVRTVRDLVRGGSVRDTAMISQSSSKESIRMTRQVPQDDLKLALAGFEGAAANFGARFIPDQKVRSEYNIRARQLSSEISLQVKSGEITTDC